MSTEAKGPEGEDVHEDDGEREGLTNEQRDYAAHIARQIRAMDLLPAQVNMILAALRPAGSERWVWRFGADVERGGRPPIRVDWAPRCLIDDWENGPPAVWACCDEPFPGLHHPECPKAVSEAELAEDRADYFNTERS
jgi:hypothetical protein